MKRNKNYRQDIIPGVVIALFSIFYLSNVQNIQVFSGLGATPLTNQFVPYLWGTVLLLLSLWILVRGIRKRKKFLEEGGVVEKIDFKKGISEKREVIASFVALTIYVALMGTLGFVFATMLYLVAQILILTPTSQWKKNAPIAVLTAVVAGILFYYIFRYKLNVLLPQGVLKQFGL